MREEYTGATSMLQIQENIPLFQFTTFHIGGPARFFVQVRTLEELREALHYAKDRSLKVLFLGGGSNMLVSDIGFPGLVIKVEFFGIEEVVDAGGRVVCMVGAGEHWDSLVLHVVDAGLWGIENLSGIPGTVGAAPVQNIGAYGTELKDSLLWVEAYDTEAHAIVTFTREECQFSYRQSVFKRSGDRYCVLRVVFRLSNSGEANLSYKDLAEFFIEERKPSVAAVRDAVLSIRAKKFPDLTKEGTAGSFFLNPILSIEEAARLRAIHPELPQYPDAQGVKISLAWLLDKGLGLRGYSIGGARLFEQQPLVVVSSNGVARDVEALVYDVQQKIVDVYDIKVVFEVQKIS